MKIGKDTVGKIHYTVYTEDGQVADSSIGEEPLEFLFDQGNIIVGLENALEGLEAGAKKVVVVAPDEAYGEFDKEAFQEVPRDQFPDDAPIEVGMQLALEDEEGFHIPAIIDKIATDTVTLNFNHPLAGRTLKFDVEILEVREATEEELEHGHPHGVEGYNH